MRRNPQPLLWTPRMVETSRPSPTATRSGKVHCICCTKRSAQYHADLTCSSRQSDAVEESSFRQISPKIIPRFLGVLQVHCIFTSASSFLLTADSSTSFDRTETKASPTPNLSIDLSSIQSYSIVAHLFLSSDDTSPLDYPDSEFT